jgi:hypothetical protein
MEASMLNEAEEDVLDAAIRVNTIIMAVALGLLCGDLLWLSTAILLLRGGHYVGKHLSLLSVFFPGYSVTWTAPGSGCCGESYAVHCPGPCCTGATRGRYGNASAVSCSIPRTPARLPRPRFCSPGMH